MLLFMLAWQRDGEIVLPERGRGTWQRDEECRACGQRRVHGINLVLQVRVHIDFSVPFNFPVVVHIINTVSINLTLGRSYSPWQGRCVINAGAPVPYPLVQRGILPDTPRQHRPPAPETGLSITGQEAGVWGR
jgi:hypothetical protein